MKANRNTIKTVLITDHPFTPGFGPRCDKCERRLEDHHRVMVAPRSWTFQAFMGRDWPVETRPPVRVRANRFVGYTPTHWRAECRVCGDVVLGPRWMCLVYANRHGARHLGRHQ